MSTASEPFPVKIIGDLIVKKIEVTDYPLGRWMELPANVYIGLRRFGRIPMEVHEMEVYVTRRPFRTTVVVIALPSLCDAFEVRFV